MCILSRRRSPRLGTSQPSCRFALLLPSPSPRKQQPHKLFADALPARPLPAPPAPLQAAAEFCLQEGSPALETLRMQAEVEAEYDSQRRSLEDGIAARERRFRAAESEVVSIKQANDEASMAALRRAITKVGVSYVAPLPADGPAASRPLPPKAAPAAFTAADVEAETLAAVDSLLPRQAMAKFAQASSDVKRAQVRELGMLALGVRLFNRARGLGGEDLDAASGDAIANAAELRRGLDASVLEALAYSLRLRRCIDFRAATSPPTDPLLVRLREELVYCLQFVSFAKALATEIADTAEAVRTLCEQLEAELSLIKGTVGSSMAVPKEKARDCGGEPGPRLD